MAALRWILLLVGLVFLAVLAAWEMRRPRRSRLESSARFERTEPNLGQMGEVSVEATEAIPSESPRVFGSSTMAAAPLASAAQVPDDGTEIAAQTVDTVQAAEAADTSSAILAAPITSAHAQLQPQPQSQPLLASHDGLLREPIVEWPSEPDRHIVSLRIVSPTAERLQGRVLRQTLAACGFVHGRFGIYHQPGSDGRATLSAASLSKPGNFDPVNMDSLRFAGLSLFAVLPGPLEPPAAFDHLLLTARDLAQRLPAIIQDEHGADLDAERIEALRQTMSDLLPTA